MITVIGSLKGGSGKSTITFNLAVWLALAGQKVLAIDADPQATLSDVVEVRNEDGIEPKVKLGSIKDLTKKKKLSQYDEVLIDVGTASLSNLKQAIKVADRIFVPVPPSQADIWSTQRFLKLVNSITNRKPPKIYGFINRGDTHHSITETDEAAAALVTLPGIEYVRARLAQRTVFRRSFSEGMALFELEPRSKAAAEWNALVAILYKNILR